jgi:uroporphyrinogen-III decarboxylase
MEARMTLRERVIRTFEKSKIDRIVYSPRLYYWYFVNKIYSKQREDLQKEIPSHFLGKSQLEIYDYLKASPRYADETLGLPFLAIKRKPEAQIKVKMRKGSKTGEYVTTHKTPLGTLKQIQNIGGGLGGHITEFPIKSIEDIKIMKYILESTEISFLKNNFDKAEEMFGDRCVTSNYISKSPFQTLVIEYMGFTRTILYFKRYPNQMEDFVKFLEVHDDQMYDQIAKSPLKIVNFGENIDGNLSTPPFFEKYHIPYYKKRVKQLHQSGKICHIHIDGSLKDLLPYLEDLPFDGLEALTARPQGDVSLEEIRDSIGNKVLLDGIPSILFLPQYSNNYVSEYARKVLDLFSPNLILGVSDELSPNGDIKKIEMIGDIVRKYELN